jgi:hypothetical protein
MHAGADAWELESMVRSGEIRNAANALAPLLPALTQANGRFLRGASQDEKLDIVAEGLAAGLQDLSVALQKYPQMAEQFGIGKGAGGFGIDAYIKSYIRDWTTVRSLQLDPSGQPTYQVPADALELMAYEGSKSGRGTIEAIEDTIRGSRNGLEAALRMDRLVSAAQSTKEGDPNTNATNFAQTVFSMEDGDMVSTQLTREAAGDVRLSFATRRPDDATKGFYDSNPSETLVDERIEAQGIPGFSNATLAARLKGIDTKSPDAASRSEEVRAAQQWIADNAERLERDREDLNRGIIHTDQGPRSIGRGLVISSVKDSAKDRVESRAFLAGNTQGMNTSYREEVVNDENTTPLDRAQDYEREAILNNQVDLELEGTKFELTPEASKDSGVDIGVSDQQRQTLQPLSSQEQRRLELQRENSPYSQNKLYFKNLGPNAKGAMAEGEAAAALAAARAWSQALPDTLNYMNRQRPWRSSVTTAPDADGIKHVVTIQHPSPDWQPEAGWGFEVGASEPVRVPYGPTLAPRQGPSVFPRAQYWEEESLPRIWSGNSEPVDKSVVLDSPGEYEPTRVTRPEGVKDGAVDPYDSWYRPAPARQGTVYGERPITLTGGEVVSIPTIALHGTWAPRPQGRQPLTNNQIFELVGRPPGIAVDIDSDIPTAPKRSDVDLVGNTATAARHREALEARLGGLGEQRAKVASELEQQARAAFDADRAARGIPAVGGTGVGFGQSFAPSRELAEGEAPFRDDQQYRDHRTASQNLYDAGDVSGYGRRGTQAWGLDEGGQPLAEQRPIVSAPVSTLPAAAQEQLNTLRSGMERPVAAYTDQELSDARARHIGDWISKAAAQGLNSRGAQISGWTGGDSWHGGARLAGRADNNVAPYTPASDGLLQTLAKLARRPVGAR